MLLLRRLIHIPIKRYSTTISTTAPNAAATDIKTQAPVVKEKWKVRLVKYWKNLYRDYFEVASDIVKDARDRPLRAIFLLWGSSFLFVSAQLNPNDQHFHQAIRSATNDLILVSEKLQNRKAANHLRLIENAINAGVLRRLNLGIMSVMWLDDYGHECTLYKCTCKYLKPQWRNFHQRVVDVGFWNKWWILDEAMIDYDVNY